MFTPITKSQAIEIFKALAYSFVSGFLGTLTLVSLDFVNAAANGTAPIMNLALALLAAGIIGGINAVLVAIKKLLTPADK